MPNQQSDAEQRRYVAVEEGTTRGRQQGLVAALHQRQELARRSIGVPERPQREAVGDRWFGLRQSDEQKRHYNRLVATYHAGIEADQTHQWNAVLEHRIFSRTLQVAAAQEHQLLQLEPGSLTAAVGEQLALDSIERGRMAADVIMGRFHDGVLRDD